MTGMHGPPCIPDSHLYRVTNTRRRIGTVISPDDEHIVARNMYRNNGQVYFSFVSISIRIENKSFERVGQFRYLGINLMNQNSIHEKIKSRLKSGNACYHSVHTILSSGLLSKEEKIKIYRTIISPVVLYGCETWSLTLREENRLRVFENRVLRRIFGFKRDEVTGEWRRLHNKELNDLCPSPSIIRVMQVMKNEIGGVCSMYGGEERYIQGFVGET